MGVGVAEARLGQRLGSLESEAGREDGPKWKEGKRYSSSQSQAWEGGEEAESLKSLPGFQPWVRSLRNRTELGEGLSPT